MFKLEIEKILAAKKITLSTTSIEFDKTTIEAGKTYRRYEMGITSKNVEYTVVGFAPPELRGNAGELYPDAPTVIVRKLGLPAWNQDEYHILSARDVAFYIKKMEA